MYDIVIHHRELPQTKIDINQIAIPKNVQLADPGFSEPRNVDVLIAAGLYWKIIVGTPLNQIQGQPALQNIRLSWIVGREILSKDSNPSSTMSGYDQ